MTKPPEWWLPARRTLNREETLRTISDLLGIDYDPDVAPHTNLVEVTFGRGGATVTLYSRPRYRMRERPDDRVATLTVDVPFGDFADTWRVDAEDYVEDDR